ncbi:MAG: thioredoxin family protein [Ferruginibacter sp.]|jgi:thiol-disulfide isomerase/thioredoxin
MKKLLLSAVLAAFASTCAIAQAPYVVEKDPKHPEEIMLTGIISKYILQNNDSFGWYRSNQNGYTPDPAIVQTLDSSRAFISLIIFGGTWCDDTRFILPKLFKWQEQTGFPDKSISFFGVNRDKQTPGNITNALNIVNVPTIIVMKNGKEIGRVVEYGKTGKWDTELASIIRSAQ